MSTTDTAVDATARARDLLGVSRLTNQALTTWLHGLPGVDQVGCEARAAGLGTRMRPLSLATPKPLIEVAGRPLIDHILDRLAAAGVTFAVVNVHHLADKVIAHLKKRTDMEIVISDETAKLLDTGGGTLASLHHDTSRQLDLSADEAVNASMLTTG